METRTSRNPFKKLVSLVIVMTMVMAMGITSFAATSDPNMTNDYSQWTLQVAPGAEVTLYASPAAKDTYAATGFDTDATTADVAWTSTNTDIAVVEENSIGFKTVDANDGVSSLTGLYCAKATVKVPATATIGSCSIEARNTKTNAYVNFTIVVDTTVTQDADNVNVYLVDYMDTLAAGTVSHSTMNFATPTDALANLAANSDYGFSYNALGSYIKSMTYADSEIEAYYNPDTKESFGWNYRVYREDATGAESYMVADSAIIASDAFQLQDNDTVVWMYGTMEAAEAFYTETLSSLY